MILTAVWVSSFSFTQKALADSGDDSTCRFPGGAELDELDELAMQRLVNCFNPPPKSHPQLLFESFERLFLPRAIHDDGYWLDPHEDALAWDHLPTLGHAMIPIEVSLITVPLDNGQTKRLRLSFSADHLLLAIFVIALLGLFILYRRETDNQNKLRLAAAGGLISVIFLCTAIPLPWTEAPASTSDFNLCSLGQDAYCIGASAITKDLSVNETTELIDHAKSAAAAIGAAQITLILLFLPACLWLLVAPLSRGAQALVYGASVPGFSLCLSTLIYRGFLWPEVIRQRGAADVSLIAGITAVVVAIAVAIRARKALAEANQSVEIPQARTKR